MAKVADLVRDALLLIRVIDAKQPVKDVDMRDGIRALNLMMTRIEANGLALGWSNVDNPSDDLPFPDEALEPIGYNLAVHLRARYGTPLEPDVLELARHGMNSLRRDRMVEMPLSFDRHGDHYDIRTDSYV